MFRGYFYALFLQPQLRCRVVLPPIYNHVSRPCCVGHMTSIQLPPCLRRTLRDFATSSTQLQPPRTPSRSLQRRPSSRPPRYEYLRLATSAASRTDLVRPGLSPEPQAPSVRPPMMVTALSHRLQLTMPPSDHDGSARSSWPNHTALDHTDHTDHTERPTTMTGQQFSSIITAPSRSRRHRTKL